MRRALRCQPAQSASRPAEGSKPAPIGLTTQGPIAPPTTRGLTGHFVPASIQGLFDHFAVPDFADSANHRRLVNFADFECTELFDPALRRAEVACLGRTALPGPA